MRQLWLPDRREVSVTYLCDLKIDPEARGRIVLLKLAHAVQAWHSSSLHKTFSVVMDGTVAILEVDSCKRSGKEPNVCLHGKQKVRSNRFNLEAFFSPVRVLSECPRVA